MRFCGCAGGVTDTVVSPRSLGRRHSGCMRSSHQAAALQLRGMAARIFASGSHFSVGAGLPDLTGEA